MARSLDEVSKDIEDLTVKAKKLTDEATVASEKNNDEGLSMALMKLARVNLGLGRLGAYAKYIARNADRAARRKRAQLTLEYSKTTAVNKATMQAELDVEDDFTVASDAQLVADEVSDLTFRTSEFLDMARSRLSLIKTDKRG